MGLHVESAVSVTGVLNQVQDDRNGAGDGDGDNDYDDDYDDDNDQISREPQPRIPQSRIKSTNQHFDKLSVRKKNQQINKKQINTSKVSVRGVILIRSHVRGSETAVAVQIGRHLSGSGGIASAYGRRRHIAKMEIKGVDIDKERVFVE